MRDVDALLNAGIKAQLEKLDENGHKKGFDNLDTFESYYLLVAEVKELRVEIYMSKTDYQATRKEFADIANFAHMGILACDKEINK